MKTVSGNIVDVLNSEIFTGTISILNGKIEDITKEHGNYKHYIVPGLVDSHIHIESSMLIPSEFARVAAVHGTVSVVSDPHEIANVLGVEGVKYMLENGKDTPMKFFFGAPSCVPASPFETSGAVIESGQVEELLQLEEIPYLGEVMNFPGVINGDQDILEKIAIAGKHEKPIDGHAPGLRGEGLKKYVSAGISTDHECCTKSEALEKIGLGMKIHIREGSAAKNFEELIPLLEENYKSCMFCSDDKHPDDLAAGHINDLVRRASGYGIDIMKTLTAACVNPVLHYKLDVGLLRRGDYADFLIIDNINDFNVLKTYINGEIVAKEGKALIPGKTVNLVNNFKVGKKSAGDFALLSKKGRIKIIEAIDGRLITRKLVRSPETMDGYVISDVKRDILKIAVVNRYREAKPAIGFVADFGLKKGAIASSVAHDSHNIIAVGVNDEDICRAVNLVIEHKGGISTVSEEKEMILPLPVAGIMSNEDYLYVAGKYAEIDKMAGYLGSGLKAPFMTLSFMALLVIPKIKMSDLGLFDGEQFCFIDLFEEAGSA